MATEKRKQEKTPENERFEEAKRRVLGDSAHEGGIGTLAERALHKILKLYFDPDESHHEIKISGSVADIKNDSGIIEIQTRALARLRPKLDKFLREYPVTVVFPLDYKKYIRYLDHETGQISERKLSPKHATVYDAAFEIYNLKDYIGKEGFSVKLVFVNVDEYRIRNERALGRMRRKVRIERIPSSIESILTLSSPEDYKAFIPPSLANEFCAADYGKAVGKRYKWEYSAVRILLAAGLIESVGRVGRKNMFKII